MEYLSAITAGLAGRFKWTPTRRGVSFIRCVCAITTPRSDTGAVSGRSGRPALLQDFEGNFSSSTHFKSRHLNERLAEHRQRDKA